MALRGAREARGSGELCAVGIWMGMGRALPKQQPGVEEPLKVTQILKHSWFFNLYLIFTQNAVFFFPSGKNIFLYISIWKENASVFTFMPYTFSAVTPNPLFLWSGVSKVGRAQDNPLGCRRKIFSHINKIL